MKVSILLPYKENFSYKKSGAVSLFVNDIVKNSNKKNKTFVFGKTDEKNFLDKNYVNLNFSTNFLKSHSKIYIKKFLDYEKENNSDIIEVHNRPAYIDQINKNTNSKIVLYFHNDPLTMNGSKTTKERINLITKVDHFIFNSYWSLNRFKIGINDIENYKNIFSVIYQSVNKPKINFKKKEKIISFIGKLNSAKGYDVFGASIIKILNKYPQWKSIVIGDEPREKHFFEHKNLKNYGYKDHKFILKKLEKTSISVFLGGMNHWDEQVWRLVVEDLFQL